MDSLITRYLFYFRHWSSECCMLVSGVAPRVTIKNIKGTNPNVPESVQEYKQMRTGNRSSLRKVFPRAA